MTRDEILALVQRRKAAWAARDPVALAATHAVHGTVASPVGGVLEGRAEIERVYRLWFSAFTDILVQQDHVVIDGDQVVVIARMSGTHSGDFFGLASAAAASAVLKNMLFGLSPHDPWSFVLVPATLAAIALIACTVPARRALKVEPTIALRVE